jgi:Protein of unknown function (DUF1592)/Protein of unknown function (DUF1588)/Protein of unknown function (DUF1587)/Protein of unknown function (DUF1595)/Protein of unknown function (DUF1585)
MQKQVSSLVLAIAGSLAAGGCAGQIGDPEETVGGGGPPGAPAPVALVSGCTTLKPGPSALRRLTRFEYNNTVSELLGDTTAPANRFPPEEQSLGFDNDTTVLRVPTLLAESYVTAAQDLTERSLTDVARLTGCDPAALAGNAASEQACAATFITSFGQRAFRRPLLADEQARMLSVYQTARAELDFKGAIGTVMETVLLAPQFMYRVESGTNIASQPGIEAVDSWGIASRLSYFLWGSMPDAALFDAARAGALQTREQVRAQAERMFDDPRTRVVVRHFHDYWLELLNIEGQGKDPAVFPDYNAQIGSLLRRQTEAFAEQVYFGANGNLADLLTAPFNMMNETLAKYYGVTGPVGDQFVKVDLDPTRNAGLLTQGSIMSWNATANRTHPILRGKFVREKLLCSPLPNPPDNIVDNRGSVNNPNATERERLAAHRNNASCAACHTLMDPIGFGLENFDASGRWRELESGKPVDTSGEIAGTDVAGTFVGPIELAKKLAQSQDVETCLVSNWSLFANGRPETKDDACVTESLVKQFRTSGRSLRELLLSMTQTDAFLYRTAPTAAATTPESSP